MLIWMLWLIRYQRWPRRLSKLRSLSMNSTFRLSNNATLFISDAVAEAASGLRTATLVGFGSSAEILRQVLNTSLWAISFGAGWVDSDKLTIGDTSTHVEDILDLVELAAAARQDRSSSELGLKCIGDLGVGVGLARAGSDTSISQPIVSRQILEQSDGGVEEIDELVFLLVVGITIGVQGRVASAVLAPFVLPGQMSGINSEFVP